jgi:error-prone DNA polymerase
MGFYTPSQLIQDAARHGIEVRPVCVQSSGYDHTLETCDHPPRPLYPLANVQGALRLGLRLVKGLGEAAARRIEAVRPFTDPADLSQRAALTESDLKALARAGALAELSGHRHQAHWDAAAIRTPSALWQVAEVQERYERDATLPAPSQGQDMLADYRYLGLTLGPHPIALRDHRISAAAGAQDRAAADAHGQFVQIAGLVTCRQRPSSASGVVFLTLEDETGNANVVIWTSILDRFRTALLQGQLLKIKGTLERAGKVIHVVTEHVSDRSELLTTLAAEAADTTVFGSRDFH